MFWKKKDKPTKDKNMPDNKITTIHSNSQPGLGGVKNIIAIASGKGGVGKSTVSVNLAIALQMTGAKVGLMDADIYGPSQPGMLGSDTSQPEVLNGFLKPKNKYGVDFISMGLLVGENTPVIWRAPMAMKMIQQFIGSVIWGDLDYLLIDLPPGTGDVQLTLAQQAKLTGAVIVTTPQQVALGVAAKGLKMFEQVKVPIVGIIENMSGFTCGHCGETTAVFKEGGGKQMAESAGIPYLGSLPLDLEIMQSGDDGVPVLVKNTDSIAAKAITAITENFKKQADKSGDEIRKTEPKDMTLEKDGRLTINWPDGHKSEHSAYQLRLSCPCAACIDEDTGQKLLDNKTIPLDIKISAVNPVGRYGLSVGFSDSHDTGIYIYERLRDLCECSNCSDNKKDDSFSI